MARNLRKKMNTPEKFGTHLFGKMCYGLMKATPTLFVVVHNSKMYLCQTHNTAYYTKDNILTVKQGGGSVMLSLKHFFPPSSWGKL